MMLYPNGLATVPWITSDFGWRLHPIFGDWRLHTGVDTIQHPGGLNYSPVTGVIIFASYNGGAGNHIKIREDVTGCVAEIKHNAHLNWVFVGMRVTAGQGLAPTGTTGDSTGIHCHGEIRPDGVTPVDPIPYIAARLGGTAGDGGTAFPTEGDTVLSFIHINSGKDNDMFVVDQRLVLDHATGIFRVLYDGEYAILEATHPEIKWAQHSPDVAKSYIARGGLRAYEVPSGAPRGFVGKLTGEIIFTAKDRRYPLTQSVNPGSGGAVDMAKITAAAKEGAEAGVKALKVPTADENGRAARAAIVKP